MHIKNKHLFELWIGLAKVKASTKGSLCIGNGAFVNVLGWSHNKGVFRKKVRLAVQKIGLDLIRLEDAEPFGKRIAQYTVDKSLVKLAKDVNINTASVQFGTFHFYD